MDPQKQFLAEVNAFLKAQKMKPTTLGRVVLGDPSFMRTLKRGRAPGLHVVSKIREFMASHRVDA